MFSNFEHAKINLVENSGTNPSYACAELIASINKFGLKQNWYCEIEDNRNGKYNHEKTIFNIISIAVSAQNGYNNDYDYNYLIRIAENINWSN
jgi:hypothetical protein